MILLFKIYPLGYGDDMKDRLVEIGKRMREVRLSLGLNQEEVADRAQTNTCNISDIEHGKTNCKLDTFVRIIEAMGASADYVLGLDVSMSKDYQLELEHVLDDCTKEEAESILQLIRSIKATYRKK